MDDKTREPDYEGLAEMLTNNGMPTSPVEAHESFDRVLTAMMDAGLLNVVMVNGVASGFYKTEYCESLDPAAFHAALQAALKRLPNDQ
jgi:hypothetical protein